MPELTEATRVDRELFLKSMVPSSRSALWVTKRIAEQMEDLVARRGETIFEVGSPAADYFFIVSGEVEMTRPDARPFTITGPGLVGVLDVALARPHLRAAIARTDVRMLRLDARAWFDALEDSFELASAVLRNVSMRAYTLRSRPAPAGGFDVTTADVRASSLTTVVDRILFLGDVPLLRQASTQALTSLAEASAVLRVAAGEEVFATGGAHPPCIFIVGDGEVLATHAGGGPSGSFRAGSVVGGPAALVRHHGDLTARATTDAIVLTILVDDYFDLMEEHFSLARAAMAFMASELDTLAERDASLPP